jgi:transcriptional regulator with XRE-family HTH domain
MLKDFAKDLKALREKKNISLMDIYAETRVHTSVFENLENGNFSFQPQTYIRAFLKQYSKAIGVDPDEVLRNYDLAKSGKYRTKMFSEGEKPVEKKTQSEEPVIEKTQSDEPVSDMPFTQKDSKEKSHTSGVISISANKPQDLKPRGIPSPLSNLQHKISKESLNKILKYAGSAVVFLLIIIGGYFLVKSMFLKKPGGSDKEIIRQNPQEFDKVVEENEKKILGKRTEKEIQDSIYAAQQKKDSLELVNSESLKLTVAAKKEARMIVLIDELTDVKEQRKVINFKKDDKKEFNARTKFYITSKSIKNFVVKLNGKEMEFKGDKVEDFMLSKKNLDKDKEKDKGKDKEKERKKKSDN